MLTRQLVERVKVDRGIARNARASRLLFSGLLVAISKIAIAALAVGALATLPSNPYSPWRALQRTQTTDRMRLFAAMARLEKIEKAVQVFYLDSGIFPQNLTDLVQYGYLHRSALQDPWGRPWEFRISTGGYQLLGRDAAGESRPELTISRTFSAVQQMMLSGDVPQASP